MTIWEIRNRIEKSKNDSFFFSPKTLRWFGQKMSDFSANKQPDGRIKISAPAYVGQTGQLCGTTVFFYNPIKNKMDFE